MLDQPPCLLKMYGTLGDCSISCPQELGRTFKTLGVGWAWETLRR